MRSSLSRHSLNRQHPIDLGVLQLRSTEDAQRKKADEIMPSKYPSNNPPRGSTTISNPNSSSDKNPSRYTAYYIVPGPDDSGYGDYLFELYEPNDETTLATQNILSPEFQKRLDKLQKSAFRRRRSVFPSSLTHLLLSTKPYLLIADTYVSRVPSPPTPAATCRTSRALTVEMARNPP